MPLDVGAGEPAFAEGSRGAPFCKYFAKCEDPKVLHIKHEDLMYAGVD